MEVCWACAHLYRQGEGTQTRHLRAAPAQGDAGEQCLLPGHAQGVFGHTLGVDIHMSDGDSSTLRT